MSRISIYVGGKKVILQGQMLKNAVSIQMEHKK